MREYGLADQRTRVGYQGHAAPCRGRTCRNEKNGKTGNMDSDELPSTETFTFEQLGCWQEARKLRILVARDFVGPLPAEERWRLGDQLLRAARSTTANIAEGYGRYHYKDNYRFCSQSRGSCFEVLDHLITAVDEGLLPELSLTTGRAAVYSAVKVLNGYMKYLRRHAAEGTR